MVRRYLGMIRPSFNVCSAVTQYSTRGTSAYAPVGGGAVPQRTHLWAAVVAAAEWSVVG